MLGLISAGPLPADDHIQTVPEPIARSLWQQAERIARAARAGNGENVTGAAAVARLFNSSECALPRPEAARAAMHRAEAERLRADKGVELSAVYGIESNRLNTDNGQSGHVQLSWDLLDGGYTGAQRAAERARIRAEIAQAEDEFESTQRKLRCIRTGIEDQFLSSRSRWLTLKRELMLRAYAVERRGYFQGYAYLDELMVSEADLRALRDGLRHMHERIDSSAEMRSRPPLETPLLDIDLTAVLRAIDNDEGQIRLAALERTLAAQEVEAKRSDIRLRLFLRQGMGSSEEQDISAGVRISVPLTFGDSARGNALAQETRTIRAEHTGDRWERATRAESAYLQFRNQFQRTRQQHYRVSRAWERLRRSLAERRASAAEADVAVAVTRARALADAALEMAEARATLYRAILDTFIAARVPLTVGALRTVALPEITDRRRTGLRLVYLWSDTLTTFPPELLMEFIVAKGVDRVAVSGGPRVPRKKRARFIRLAQERGVEVSSLRGSPGWFDPARHEAVIDTLRGDIDRIGNLHLDVEPYVLEDFDRDPQSHLNGYLQLLERLRRVTDSETRITVSVPIHWPDDVYKRLDRHVDEIVLMAYEETRPARLLERLRGPLGVLSDAHVKIAVRASDFRDEAEMERLLDRLAGETNIKHFAIHDFGGYMRLSSGRP